MGLTPVERHTRQVGQTNAAKKIAVNAKGMATGKAKLGASFIVNPLLSKLNHLAF
jgi:hypothetical protein